MCDGQDYSVKILLFKPIALKAQDKFYLASVSTKPSEFTYLAIFLF